DIKDGDFVLCTIHRAENTDDSQRLKNIFQGLGDSGEVIILPLHPRTRAKIADYGIAIPENVWVIDPVGYLEMVWLEANCRLVATDSGGVQKEAYFHGKFCVTLREDTEWVELVDIGANRLVGVNPRLIAESIKEGSAIDCSGTPYGMGDSADRISKILK
ncbi:MAG: UDP-N-acetylglucosamine 2-epimerase, partial [Marinobacter sp.]